MASWFVQRRPGAPELAAVGQLEVLYVNNLSQEIVSCGLIRGDTPLTMLVDWLASNADEGDVLVFPDRVMLVQLGAAA